MGVCRGVGVVQQYPSLSFKKSSTLSWGVGRGGGAVLHASALLLCKQRQ